MNTEQIIIKNIKIKNKKQKGRAQKGFISHATRTHQVSSEGLGMHACIGPPLPNDTKCNLYHHLYFFLSFLSLPFTQSSCRFLSLSVRLGLWNILCSLSLSLFGQAYGTSFAFSQATLSHASSTCFFFFFSFK